MIKEDVCSAIADAFRRDFAQLEFERGMQFQGIDKAAGLFASFDGEFMGAGEYYATLVTGLGVREGDVTTFQTYTINGKVQVTESEGSPVVSFIGTFSARKQ